ncbi:carboxymuconolactone decarboxylase family protein [Kocuria sp. M1R5S2]|uniref:carboxymuconolactone decarboxylase family protein n=1 Tax=Kocuria rhizosphaerae TaxID=3376285 RepID=UPI0037B32DB9
MTVRGKFFLDKSDPGSWRALNKLSRRVASAAQEAGISRAVVELLNVRVSQLNGCAYCLELHTRYAVDAGVGPQKLSVLPVWRETALFSELERAALAIGEATTSLPEETTRVRELTDAREHLDDAQYSALQWAAVTINAFNRISILSRHPIRPRRAPDERTEDPATEVPTTEVPTTEVPATGSPPPEAPATGSPTAGAPAPSTAGGRA